MTEVWCSITARRKPEIRSPSSLRVDRILAATSVRSECVSDAMSARSAPYGMPLQGQRFA
jgi:hypothetical protein